jgi:hypothetical protein
MSVKNSNDTNGNELLTFRRVAQCFNQLRYRVSPLYMKYKTGKLVNKEPNMEKM